MYDGDGPIYPIVTDAENKALLAWNNDNQALEGPGIKTEDEIADLSKQTLDTASLMKSTVSSGVYPILTDSSYRVIFGWDATNSKPVIANISAIAGSTSNSPDIPLPAEL